ncbi:hypothetical protein GGQ57_004232 [Parabacteroides faecis]|uniref:Uncharacterized protein n=1 Tax=Parabacteroides faecis TaxID=1217282 RepID=A0ABR6KSC2_9BACT|nr:hypothetical protein [Parabacteroides faecis]
MEGTEIRPIDISDEFYISLKNTSHTSETDEISNHNIL